MQFQPQNPTRLVIGTEFGVAMHQSRFKEPVNPRYYHEKQKTIADPITCLDFNLFEPKLFLVGYRSGRVCIYNTDHDEPVCSWSTCQTEDPSRDVSAQCVKVLKWSPQRPSVFFVLGERGMLFVYDLSENNRGPVCTSDCLVHEFKGAVLDMAMSPGLSQMRIAKAVHVDSLQNNLTNATRHASIGVSFDDGSVVVLILHDEYVDEAVDEEAALQIYLA